MTAIESLTKIDMPRRGPLFARLILRIYRARGASEARPPLNLPGYLPPVLLVAALLLTVGVFHLLNVSLYGMLQDRLDEGITVQPSNLENPGLQALPADLLGVFELTRRIAPGLDVSAEFAANIMPYLEQDSLTEDERTYLRSYQQDKFTNDPLWIETDLLFRVMQRRAEAADGAVVFAFGAGELEAFLRELTAVSAEKPVMAFMDVMSFTDVPGGPDCPAGSGDGLGCRLEILLAGFASEPNALGLLPGLAPGPLEGRLYSLNTLSSLFRENQSRVEDTRTLITALFEETAQSGAVYRRMLQAVNGPIQWVTVAAALWCALILLFRRSWARLQEAMSSGRRLAALDPEFAGTSCPWGGPDGERMGAARDAVRLYGSQILPYRLLRSLAAEKLQHDKAASPGLIERIVEGYRAQVAEQEYSIVGWLIMLVPTLGFIGTIYGMMQAMGGAHLIVAAQDQSALEASVLQLSEHLGTAFDTTLIALVMAALLEGLRAMTQREEARAFDSLARHARDEIESIRRHIAAEW